MSTKFYNLKQEISNSPQIDEAVSEKAIKEYVDGTHVVVTMTVTTGTGNTYTVSSPSHTPTQVQALLAAGKKVVIKATKDRTYDIYMQVSFDIASYAVIGVTIGSLVGTSTVGVRGDVTQDTWTYGETAVLGYGGYQSSVVTGDALIVFPDNSLDGAVRSTGITFDTSNTSDFLRADGTWATPSGGGGGDTGYTSSTLSDNTSTITFGSTKEYQVVAVTGSTQTFNVAVNNRCTNYLLVTNGGSSDCAVAIGVQSGTLFTNVVKPSAGITVGVGKAVELSFISIAGGTILVVTVSAEMEVDTLS